MPVSAAIWAWSSILWPFYLVVKTTKPKPCCGFGFVVYVYLALSIDCSANYRYCSSTMWNTFVCCPYFNVTRYIPFGKLLFSVIVSFIVPFLAAAFFL